MKLIIKLLKYWISLIYWNNAPIDKVKKMQLRKFREVFEYARENSPFYKQFYAENGVSDLVIRTWEDVEKVPVVEKSTLKQCALEDILTCPINDDIKIHSTSGSTGEPFQIAYSKYEDYTGHVRLFWLLMKHGYTPFKKMMLVTRNEPGQKFDVEKDVKFIGKLQHRLHCFEREVASIYDSPQSIISRIENNRPFVLWTTPSAAFGIAEELKHKNKRLSIPLLLLISENISDDQALLFKERLCKRFINHYGCMEAPTMSYAFNNNDVQLTIPNFVLCEQVRKRKVAGNVVGDMVITNFVNKTMPFIRYSLGDFVEVLNEENGMLRFGKIYGRINDIIEVNGEQIFHMRLSQIFRGYTKCKQYKLVQLSDGSLELQLIVADNQDDKEVKDEAEKMWNEKFPSIPIKVVLKKHLEIDQHTGKFKVIERILQ